VEIKEMYEHFDKIGCLTFTTWTGSEVISRIAHFFANYIFEDELHE